MTKTIKRIFAGVTTATCATMMLAGSFVPAFALTIEELEAQIADLQAQLLLYQDQLDEVDGETVTPVAYEGIPDGFTFDNALYYGMSNSEVKYLQIILNADAPTTGDQVAQTSYGSPGSETNYFGPLTKAAAIKFQERYADDVLAYWGLTSGTGYVGQTTRAKLNELLAAVEPEPPVVEPSDFDNEDDCVDADFFWYDDVCNESAQPASDYDNEEDCEAADFFWYDDVCNESAMPASDYDNEEDCEAADFFWYDDACHSTAEGEVSAAGLTMVVADDTPVADTLADGSAYNSMLKLKFTAGAEGDVEITGLTVTKGGISTDTYVSGILLIDEDGDRHGVVITALDADSKAALAFSDDPLVVPAGESVYGTIQVNLGSSFPAGTINMRVASSDDVASDASEVSGSFPLIGNTMSVVDGDATIGGLTVDATLFHDNATNDATAVNVNLGTVDQIISKFKFTESAGNANEDVQIEKITIYNNGNTTNADITNIDLVAPDGTVLATLESLSSKYGTFDLSATPYVIPDGSNKTLTLRCDIASGSTRTIRFLIEQDYDVVAFGVSSGAGILATNVSTSGLSDNTSDVTFPVGDRLYASTSSDGKYMNKVTIASGSLSVSKDTSSASGNVAAGATNQQLAVFKLTASGEDMRVERIQVCISTPNSATAYELAGTVKLKDANDVTLWSLAASGDTLYNSCTQRTLTTRKTVPGGTSETLKLVGDIKTAATSAMTYQVAIRDLYTKRMSTGDYVTYSADSDVNGNTLTVSASALSLAKNDAYGNSYGVSGSAKFKYGSFVLQAGSAEAINISSMKFVITPDSSGSGVIGDYSNLVVEKSDGTQLGSTVVSPTATTGDTISVSGFQIPASGSELINVFVDISSDAESDEAGYVTLSSIGATGAVSATSLDSSPTTQDGQTITWQASGILAVSTDTATPSVAVLHASESDAAVLKFTLSSTYEAIDVTKIVLESTYGAANVSNVKLYDGTTLLGTANLLSGKVTFSGLSLEVPKDGAKYLTVKVGTTASGTLRSAEVFKLMVSDIESTGAGSGVVVYPTAITTVASAGSPGTTAAAVTVTSSNDFAVGDAVLVFNTTDGVEWGMVTAIGSAVSITIATEASTTVATTRVTRLASPVTTAASAGTPSTTTAEITVTSTAGFALGDPVIVYDATNGVEIGMVTSITDATKMYISTKANLGGAAERVTKLSSSASTVSTSKTVTEAAVTLEVTSTTGFAAGDVIFVYGGTAGVELGMVTSVTDSDTMVVSAEDSTATVTRVTKLATFNTTAATAGLPLDTGAAVTVSSVNGFAVGDVVAVYGATSGVEIGLVATVTPATPSLTIHSKNDMITTAASRVSELWSITGTGNPYVLHDVEPTITVNSASPTIGSPSTLETVAKFDITANGTRDLKIESILLYRGGSETTDIATSDVPKVYVGSTLLGQGDSWSSAAAGASDLVTFTSPRTITAGNTVTFDVKVDTSSIETVNATFQIYIDGTAGVKTGANTAVDWYYVAASPSPGTEPTQTTPATFCDNYPVYGNALRY